jgi:hypothetical protein
VAGCWSLTGNHSISMIGSRVGTSRYEQDGRETILTLTRRSLVRTLIT